MNCISVASRELPIAGLQEAVRFIVGRGWSPLEEKTKSPPGGGVRIAFPFVVGCVANYAKHKEVF
jgi:hypothetical protein